MDSPEITNEKIKYKGRNITIKSHEIKFPNGKTDEWETPDSNFDVVTVVAFDGENVLLSKEWRAYCADYVTMNAAGAIDKNASEEQRLQQARNELQEELGVDAKNVEKLITTYGSARTRIRHDIYLATDLFESKLPGDEHEYIEVVKMPFNEALEMFLSEKEETNSYTILGLLLAKKKLNL